jgi:predicted unusual protein kinase regulating ubiquinone biosynthesis (AarF/ABC1/UbiB family)
MQAFRPRRFIRHAATFLYGSKDGGRNVFQKMFFGGTVASFGTYVIVNIHNRYNMDDPNKNHGKIMYKYLTQPFITPFVTFVEGHVRLLEFAYVLSTIYTDYFLLDHVVNLQHKSEATGKTIQQLKEEVHTKSAEKLVKLFRKHGGIYMALGRQLETMRGNIPDEYCDMMKKLQDKAPYMQLSELEGIFLAEFGKPIQELFAEFDIVPIASANIAQVHWARLLDTKEEVAVKVQYPKISKYLRGDLKAYQLGMYLLGNIYDNIVFDKSFEQQLTLELDFQNEVKNNKRMQDNFAEWSEVHIPKVIDDMSRNRILTMEYINGVRVNNKRGMIQRGIDPEEVCNILFESYAEMIFRNGFVHGDPHESNLMVRKSKEGFTQVVFLDHALYYQLSPGFCTEFSNLCFAVDEGDDSEATVEFCKKHNISNHDIFIDAIKNNKDIYAADPNTSKEIFLIQRCDRLLHKISNDLGITPVDQFTIYARVAKSVVEALENKVEVQDVVPKRRWFAELLAKVRLFFARLYVFIIEKIFGVAQTESA